MNTQRRAGLAAELTVLALTVAAQVWLVWIQLPPQQRFWIRLSVLGWVRSTAGRFALRAGHGGMSDELRTGQMSPLYLTAWAASLARDRAHRALDDMRG